MSEPELPIVVTHRLDTSELPVDKQFAIWARHTPNTRITPAAPGPFLARGSFWDLGAAAVAESSLDGFLAERDEELIRATSADHYLLVGVFGGQTRFRANGIDAVCGPGAAFVCDFTRPSSLTTAGVHCATVAMPRNFVGAATMDAVLHGPLPRGAATDLLLATLAMLVKALPAMQAASAPFYARVVRDLLAAAAVSVPERNPRTDASRRAIVIRHMEQQPPGELSVSELAGGVGLSRPTLYRLFTADGGVIAHDRMRRLRAVHRDLADPLNLGTIAEIGASHGFVDRNQLARLFRSAFGCSMTEFRRRLRSLNYHDADTPFAERLRAVVRRLAT